MINFGKTMKQPKVWNEELGKEVREKIIYHTKDDWCRIAWHKFGKLYNSSMYEFKPSAQTKSGIGFRQQLSKALDENPLLRYKYPYYPLRKLKEA